MAQQATSPPFSGSVTLGLRNVDVDGTPAKYDEDINLDDGVRILNADFRYAAPADSDAALDSIDITANNLGGDPFENVHLSARKYGRYKLALDHNRSQYFYADTILPAAVASVTGSTGGDFHHFDFERVRDKAELDITLSPATQLSFGLLHQSRIGDSTTTLDIARDEFELDRPIDESLNEFDAGISHAFERVTIAFTERVSSFENASELFLPGASPGQNTTDLSELQFFRLDQSYDYDSRAHELSVIARPSDALDIRAAWRYEDLDLGMHASEQSLGTNFDGTPLATDVTGPADVGRDIETALLDVGYTIGEHVRIIGGLRRSTLEQDGFLSFGTDQGSSLIDLETTGVEAGVEYAINANIAITGGWSSESRALERSHVYDATLAAERHDTDRDGFFARLLLRTEGGLELSASVEDDAIDDPYTLASATDTTRYKFRLRRSWSNGMSFSGTHRRTDAKNGDSRWSADTGQTELRLSYEGEGIAVAAGVGNVNLTRDIIQLVIAGTRSDLVAIDYDADASFGDIALRWKATEDLTIGTDLRSYENRGSYRLSRDDIRLYFDYALNETYALQLSYRNVDYAEDAYDAYEARIFELGLRLML